MSLSNTAVPRYYGEFRDAVVRGEIAINQYIAMEMNRIDRLIANPGIFYDDQAVEGWVRFCEAELTLTDGSDLHMLDSFKLWGEEIFGWYYYEEHQVMEETDNGGVRYVTKLIKQRLTKKQYLIVARGAAKTMYDACIHGYFLTVDKTTTHQITTAPTMRQADEVLAPLKTAIIRSKGPLFQFLTSGSLQNTTGPKSNRQKLASTKKGIENLMTGSLLEVRAMDVDSLQGLRCKIATIDEWLSCDTREDVVGPIEQGASKFDDYLIVLTSSEGIVRNSIGDTMKMELIDILKGEYEAPHVSIWYYRLDDQNEVGDPRMWEKANPNIGKTVKKLVYQLDVERMEKAPSTKNDILAKRFGIPTEGYTYFFTYDETIKHAKSDFWGMPCSLGADMSQGDDFCAFTFLFPLRDGSFGVKTRSYITSLTYARLSPAMKQKYQEFIEEGSLVILDGTVLKLDDIYDELDGYIQEHQYEILTFGFDPYNAREFVERWERENGPYGIEKVQQGAKTETVPLGEIKKLSEERMLIFDQELMSFTMGNAIALEDTNGNRKLFKKRRDEKIDNVSALLDAYVAFKRHSDDFEN